MSRRAAAVTSSTARVKAASFAREGLVEPLNLRTNWSADARISSSVAGGAKLARVLILRHMGCVSVSSAAESAVEETSVAWAGRPWFASAEVKDQRDRGARRQREPDRSAPLRVAPDARCIWDYDALVHGTRVLARARERCTERLPRM